MRPLTAVTGAAVIAAGCALATPASAATGPLVLHPAQGSPFTLDNPAPGCYPADVVLVENRTDRAVAVYQDPDCTGRTNFVQPGESMRTRVGSVLVTRLAATR